MGSQAFVRDILGIEIEVDKIETEKKFEPRMELISFKNLTPEKRTKEKNKEAAKITLMKTEDYAKQEGKKEEKVEIAKNAIIEGASSQFISKITGLTIEQIDALRNEKK